MNFTKEDIINDLDISLLDEQLKEQTVGAFLITLQQRTGQAVSDQLSDGSNALHTAAKHGRAAPLICALIKEGVDPASRNDAGLTPADVAEEKGHTLQATLLNRATDDKRKRDLSQQQQQKQG